MEKLLTLPEFLPRAWNPCDATPALAFWLLNPLLLYHYPKRMATNAAGAERLDNDQKLHMVWRLRELRLVCRTRLPIPTTLPEIDRVAMAEACDRIEEAHERREVRSFSLRLHECELPWLVAHIDQVLTARAALQTPPSTDLLAAA